MSAELGSLTSLLPLPRHFYEQECGRLSRPSRGWARSCCPIHGGNNPTAFSVNLDSGGFYCHNCGAKGGDVLQFVRLRYDLSFADALKHFRLDDMTPAGRRELRREQQERRDDERQKRIVARNRLHCLARAHL
jgi:DNA primase